MSFFVSEAFIGGLLLAAMWSVLCRLRLLPPSRRTLVAGAQLIALGLGLFCALVLPGQAGRASLAAGVVLFLAIGAHRWRLSPPGGLSGAPPKRAGQDLGG